jgi:hypothetical protein
MNPQDYIKGRLDDQLAWYDAKSQYNQKAYKRLKTFEIVAASAIPLLSGAPEFKAKYFVIGALGAAIAVCAGISGLYKFHELWMEYRAAAESLRHHRFLFLTQAPPYQGENAFTLLVEAVEGVISKERSSWNGLQKPQSEPPAPETVLEPAQS